MATNPSFPEPSRNWPRRGSVMTEEAYHELERLTPDRKYEYIDSVAYMMSGESVAHDRIIYNMRFALDSQLRDGACTAFGVDVQVLVGVKKMASVILSILTRRFRAMVPTVNRIIR